MVQKGKKTLYYIKNIKHSTIYKLSLYTPLFTLFNVVEVSLTKIKLSFLFN